MATLIGEIPGSDTASENEEGIRELVRKFRVQTSGAERGFSALRASGLPVRYEAHPEDPLSFAFKGSVAPDSNQPGFYIVTITYSNDYNQDVTQERPEVSWEDEEYERVVDKDRNGDPILNAAGDRYEEPVIFTDSRPVLRHSRNEQFFDQLQAYQYNRSVNSDTFYGAAPGTMRVKITAQQKWRDDVEYWRVTYLFRYNPDGWQPEVLEQGLYQKIDIGSPGTPVIAKMSCTVKGKSPGDSEPVSYAVPIDADGKQIDPDDLPDDAVYTQYEVLTPLPYLALGV